MTFEGLICPNCSGQLNEDELRNGNFICPHCAKNLKDKKYVAFIEYVIMIGLVPDLDFFDQSIYGDEIEHKTIDNKTYDKKTYDDLRSPHKSEKKSKNCETLRKMLPTLVQRPIMETVYY